MSMVERRLIEIGDRLKALRDELAIADEQLAHLADEAEDARLRSLVSETPLAEREHRSAPVTPMPCGVTATRSSNRDRTARDRARTSCSTR